MAQTLVIVEIANCKGTSKDTKYKDHHEMDSISFGASNAKTFDSTSGAVGKPIFQDLQFSRSYVAGGSVQSFDNMVRGKKYDYMNIYLVERDDEAQSKEWLKIRVENCYVTAQSMHFHAGGTAESFSVCYEKMVITHVDNIKAGYHLTERKAVTS